MSRIQTPISEGLDEKLLERIINERSREANWAKQTNARRKRQQAKAQEVAREVSAVPQRCRSAPSEGGSLTGSVRRQQQLRLGSEGSGASGADLPTVTPDDAASCVASMANHQPSTCSAPSTRAASAVSSTGSRKQAALTAKNLLALDINHVAKPAECNDQKSVAPSTSFVTTSEIPKDAAVGGDGYGALRFIKRKLSARKEAEQRSKEQPNRKEDEREGISYEECRRMYKEEPHAQRQLAPPSPPQAPSCAIGLPPLVPPPQRQPTAVQPIRYESTNEPPPLLPKSAEMIEAEEANSRRQQSNGGYGAPSAGAQCRVNAGAVKRRRARSVQFDLDAISGDVFRARDGVTFAVDDGNEQVAEHQATRNDGDEFDKEAPPPAVAPSWATSTGVKPAAGKKLPKAALPVPSPVAPLVDPSLLPPQIKQRGELVGRFSVAQLKRRSHSADAAAAPSVQDPKRRPVARAPLVAKPKKLLPPLAPPPAKVDNRRELPEAVGARRQSPPEGVKGSGGNGEGGIIWHNPGGIGVFANGLGLGSQKAPRKVEWSSDAHQQPIGGQQVDPAASFEDIEPRAFVPQPHQPLVAPGPSSSSASPPCRPGGDASASAVGACSSYAERHSLATAGTPRTPPRGEEASGTGDAPSDVPFDEPPQQRRYGDVRSLNTGYTWKEQELLAAIASAEGRLAQHLGSNEETN